MFILGLNSINEHADYKNWTPLSGRLKCFEKLREYLDLIYPISKDEAKIPNNSFHEFMYYCVSNVNKEYLVPTSPTNFSLNLFQMKKKDDMHALVIEDDFKVKKQILKDDNDIHRLNNSTSLKLNRNQKVSQSLQINRVSEMEEKSYSNKKEYPVMNNEFEEKSNREVEFSDIDDETVINNKNKENSNNDLSDLDKEEYYMKSCYEYYDYVIFFNLGYY